MGLAIEGEPGIGKTTLVSGAVDLARGRGWTVLQARPAEAEAQLSFAVLGDLLGPVFDDVRETLPEPQREALGIALLRRDALEPADPRTTATALLSALTRLSERDPLLVVLDDAQWADPASLRALEFAVRRLPPRVGILVARRASGDATSPLSLETSLPPGRAERLVLGPLKLVALQGLIHARVAIRLTRPMLVRIADASGGNPFFALEIANVIARSPAQPAFGDMLPVPRTLNELLRDRIDRLSEPARAVAAVAAALSRPTLQTVEAATGSDHDVQSALEEAEAAGVLRLDGDRLQFSHPLLASTIYAASTGVLRRALHRRLAVVVVDPEERARHISRSVAAPDEAAASAIETGAAEAARRGAPEAAAELFDAACRLTPDDRPEDLARRALGAAESLTLAGDLDGARTRAVKSLAAARTPRIRARSRLLLGSLATYTEGIDARLAYQEGALSEAGDDRALRVEILLALFEEIATDAERAGRRADEAIELLQDGADAAPLARALIAKFVAGAVRGNGAQTDLLNEALALEDAGGRPGDERIRPGRLGGPISIYPLIWSHWVDDLEATRARFTTLTEWSMERGDVVGAAELGEFLAMAEFRAGNWAAAERVIEAACDVLGQFELRGPIIPSFTDRSLIDAHRGRLERARATLADILERDSLDRMWSMVAHSAQGAVEFCAGLYDAADRAWTVMREEARAVGWIDNLEDRSEPDHVEALVALGRQEDARRLLDHLEWRGRTLPRAWVDAGLPRARAMIRAAEGRPDEALAMLDDAPVVPSLPFEAARTLLVRGQLERRAKRKLAARASLTEAVRMFEELGSPPWARRTRDEMARLGLHHRAATELTESERRIGELAASGMTNREVADAAFVSPKTVEANLARVYRKLGIRSRAELGARMAASAERPNGQT